MNILIMIAPAIIGAAIAVLCRAMLDRRERKLTPKRRHRGRR